MRAVAFERVELVGPKVVPESVLGGVVDSGIEVDRLQSPARLESGDLLGQLEWVEIWEVIAKGFFGGF